MHHAGQGILFHSFDYSETSLILKVYTFDHGLKTLIHKGARKKKNKANQPLSIVQLEYYQKEGQEMGTVRSLTLETPFVSLYSDFYKSSVVLFLRELLYKTILEEESNQELYLFIREFLVQYDAQPFDANAHLWFVTHLTKYLGFQPDTSSYTPGDQFNLQQGVFQRYCPEHEPHMNTALTVDFNSILGTKFASISSLQLTNDTRRKLLDAQILYYRLQLSEMKTIHSHAILKELLE